MVKVVIQKKINEFNKIIKVDGDKSLSIRSLLIGSQSYGVCNIKNLSIHYWKHAFSIKQDNVSHFFDKNTQLGICGDSFSAGQVDGAIVSSNEVYRKILSK